jgi:hypothetical protein
MKTLLAALIAFALVGSGCVVVGHPRSARSGVRARKCPPGHVWSDGACHNRGRGNEKKSARR